MPVDVNVEVKNQLINVISDTRNMPGTEVTRLIISSIVVTPEAYIGPQGSSGISGFSGIAGPPGEQGEKGEKGDSGSLNITDVEEHLSGVYNFPQEYVRYSDLSGLSGWSGISGGEFFGSSGYSGYSGYSGASGASGSEGPRGTSGASGASGASGERGSKGDSGAPGVSGSDGESGWSGWSGWSGVGWSGVVEASDVLYTNTVNTGIQNVKDALDSLLYEPVSANLITSNSVVEIGEEIDTVALNWGYNKAIQSQSLKLPNNTVISLQAVDRNYIHTSANLTSTIVKDFPYVLTVNDGVSTRKFTSNVRFRKKRFWGISTTDPAAEISPFSSTFVPGTYPILESEFSITRKQTKVFRLNQVISQYFYILFPEEYETGQDLAQFYVNGILTELTRLDNVIYEINLQPQDNIMYVLYRNPYPLNVNEVTVVVI